MMHYFTPDQVPVISELARAFGVSDRGTPPRPARPGRTGFSRIPLPRTVTSTIIRRTSPYTDGDGFRPALAVGEHELADLFPDDIPQSVTLARLWDDVLTHFQGFRERLRPPTRRQGTLPAYSFHRAALFRGQVAQTGPERRAPAAQHRLRRGADRRRLQCRARRPRLEEHAVRDHLRRTWRLLRSRGPAGRHAARRPDTGRLSFRLFRLTRCRR